METRIQVPTQQESTIVERVARVVSNVRGIKSDYANLAAELAPIIPFDIFGVVLLRHDRQAVRITVCQREANSQLWVANYHQHPLADSRLEQLLNRLSPSSPAKVGQTEPLLIVESYPDGLDGPPVRSGDALSGFHQLHSTLIVPLLIGDRLLGTLELGSNAVNTYHDMRLQRLVGSVAQVLAAAIDGAQVGGSVEIQNRQRQALKDVSSALTSTVDLSTILNSIVEGIASSLNVASTILLYNQRTKELSLAAQVHMDEAILSKIISRKVVQSELSIIGATLRRRQVYVLQDTLEDEQNFPASRIFGIELGLRSLFSYPLVTGTTIYGILLVGSSEAGGFTPLKADILSLFASQATVAIHNGMLLESAHQRSRFQQAIEQLERAYRQQVAHGEAMSLQDEQELFKQVRSASEQTFGVSFASLMRFISDNLLTSNERTLHAAVLQAAEEGENALPVVSAAEEEEKTSTEALAESSMDMSGQVTHEDVYTSSLSQERSIVLLTQAAEEALTRTGVLSELGRLLLQLEQSTGHIQDSWLAIDLNGNCISMNPVAEAFFGMRPSHTSLPLEEVFVELLPRIRNIDEVSAYLQSFLSPSLGDDRAPICRFVLAAEPVKRREQARPGEQEAEAMSEALAELAREDGVISAAAIAELDDSTLQLTSAPSDHYHLMTRYPLYNQSTDLTAYALQIHDITEQVRDEKNKSALLSAVSHDLRTPLTIIKAAVSGLLAEGVPWDEVARREILAEVDEETDHLTDLVDALVEMSRIEMGALSLVKEWCDVVEVVHGIMIRLERRLASYTVKTDFQPQLPLVYADHVQLGKVFYRLLENAIENSAPGSEILIKLNTIEAQSSFSLAPAPLLQAQVIDQGSGIPEAERERIFKSFYSLSPIGAGLGLAICKGIVEAHMGHIWVEAAEDGGSCFVFTLPVTPYKNPTTDTHMPRNVTVDHTDRNHVSSEEP